MFFAFKEIVRVDYQPYQPPTIDVLSGLIIG